MHTSIEHIEGKYPSFNVSLHAAEGAEPFLVVKGCRIVEGQKGPFVSGPATKNATTNKYWNHTYFGDKFQAHVLKLAQAAAKPAARHSTDDQDIPFSDPLKSRAACLAC